MIVFSNKKERKKDCGNQHVFFLLLETKMLPCSDRYILKKNIFYLKNEEEINVNLIKLK